MHIGGGDLPDNIKNTAESVIVRGGVTVEVFQGFYNNNVTEIIDSDTPNRMKYLGETMQIWAGTSQRCMSTRDDVVYFMLRPLGVV